MRVRRWERSLWWGLAALAGSLAFAQQPENLLRNPGFEEELAPAWEKRTPDDAQRSLERIEGAARSGQWCLALASREAVQTRLRQGGDRTLKVPPGSLVEFTAWSKSELNEGGTAGLQLYCMGEDDQILSQPTARATLEPGVWGKVRLLAQVPPGTESCMAYLQIQGGTGRALFDDVRLSILRPPEPVQPAPRAGLLTDLPEEDQCPQNVKLLLAGGCVDLDEDRLAEQLMECEAAVVLCRERLLSTDVQDALTGFVRRGGRLFIDLRAWAAWQNLSTVAVSLAEGSAGREEAAKGASPAARQMEIGLRLIKESPVVAGFLPGQCIPYAGKDGKLLAVSDFKPPKDGEILAVAPGGQPALVRHTIGQGQIVTADVLSLEEPYFANIGGFYKYLFLANALAKHESLQLAEYYPRKLSSAEFVELMRQTAGQFPAIQFQEEGPASGDCRIYSLNLGRPGAPLYFLYAAAHGSEWEPGYGLLTFAKRLAQGRLAGAIDLERVSVKIVPLLNPAGYDRRQRQNAHGVDLNRQGDCRWELFHGRDSNQDGSYGPGDFDWKGDRPFGEPESQTYRRIIEAPNLHCILDFHGNSSGSGNNKVAVLPSTAREDNELRAWDLKRLANQRLRGRYILRQSQEKTFTPYLLERMNLDGGRPLLMNSAARDRYGLLVEVTAGYGDSYGTVLQTEVVCEVCRALFLAYPAP